MKETDRCIQIGMLSGGKWDRMHDENRRYYSVQGISPTLHTCGGGNTEVKILEEPCGIYYQESKNFYSPPLNGLSRCLKANKHDSGVIEPLICASRGRNPENPSDRTTGIDTQQRIEINKQGTSNTLTSVQKDNLVVEPKLVGGVGEINFGKQYRQGNRIYDSEAIAMCLTSQPVGNSGGNSYLYQVDKPTYRIRKLTPLECIRLMDFDDSDYEKIKAIGMSDSQIYKQCGNSIIVACLVGIFRKMYIDTEVSNEQLSFF